MPTKAGQRLLLQHGANPNVATIPQRNTPLMIFAQNGHLASTTELLQDGRCDLEMERSNTGHTAILLAALDEKWDCIELLLPYHASPVKRRGVLLGLYEIAFMHQAPPHTLQLIQAAIFEQHFPRLLHHARRINDSQYIPATDGPAFLCQRADITTYLCPAWSSPPLYLLQIMKAKKR